MNSLTIDTGSEEEVKAIAQNLAKGLRPSDIIFLYGDLGAGKTVFVKGLARGLGIREEEITSASFVIISEHYGRLPLYHIDLYRIDPEATEALGLEEYLGTDGVAVVEWAERLKDWEPVFEVYFEIKGPEERRITIKSQRDLSWIKEAV